MKILMTGGTGFIGGALTRRLARQGHSVLVLTRRTSHFDSKNISYINSLHEIPESDHCECFINLAGENMARKRWNDERKAALVESRVGTTRALFGLAGRLDSPPSVLLSASAVGYYGHQGDERLGEDARPVDGFSHRLCQTWEDEARRFEELGSRVCLMRFGVVLDREGGAFSELAGSARFGIGSWLGDGAQWLSWVHREDVLAAIDYLLAGENLSGAYNLSAPEPVTNRGFCDELARHGRGFVKLPVPAVALRLALGEMAEELLLHGQRAVPRRLLASGFRFRYDTLAEALPDLLAA